MKAYQTFEVLCKIGCKHDLSAGLIIGGKASQITQQFYYNNNYYSLTLVWFGTEWRQHDQAVRELDLQLGSPEFKSHPDHSLDLFLIVPISNPRPHL